MAFQTTNDAINAINAIKNPNVPQDKVKWELELKPFLSSFVSVIDDKNQIATNLTTAQQAIALLESSTVRNNLTYANPSWISSLAWSKILGTPTTLSGYGITDGFPVDGGSLTGTNGSGFIGYVAQSATPTTPSSGFRLFANNANALSWIGANGFVRTFDGTSNTADRVYTLPNTSGTFGLLGATQTWSGSNVFSELTVFSKNIRLGATTVSSSFSNSLFITGLSNTASSASVTLANFDNSGRWSLGVQGSGNHRIGIYDEINGTHRLLVHGNTGNITIGTTTDGGYRFDVNGTSRISNKLTIGTSTSLANGSFAASGLLEIISSSTSPLRITPAPDRTIIEGNTVFQNQLFSPDVYLAGNSNGSNDVRLRVVRSGIGANQVISTYTERYASWAAGETPRLRLSSKSFEFWSDNEATSWNQPFVRRLLSINENGQMMLTYDTGSTLHQVTAALQIDSTTRGFLPPRMTTAQRDSIVNPAEGLVIYNTTLKLLNFYNGTSWV